MWFCLRVWVFSMLHSPNAHNMSSKMCITWTQNVFRYHKVKTNRAKGRLREKITAVLLYAFDFFGWFNIFPYEAIKFSIFSHLGQIGNIFSILASTPSVKTLRLISTFASIGMLHLSWTLALTPSVKWALDWWGNFLLWMKSNPPYGEALTCHVNLIMRQGLKFKRYRHSGAVLFFRKFCLQPKWLSSIGRCRKSGSHPWEDLAKSG